MNIIEKLVADNSKDELLALVEEEDVEGNYSHSDNKDVIARAIAENRLGGPIDEEKEPVEEEEQLDPTDDSNEVVKFIGKNASFGVAGQSFSRQHPFAVFDADKAQHMFNTWPDKFRPASKKEVKDYYEV